MADKQIQYRTEGITSVTPIIKRIGLLVGALILLWLVLFGADKFAGNNDGKPSGGNEEQGKKAIQVVPGHKAPEGAGQ